MMSQQQAQYIILTLALAVFLAMAMWLSIHFIWAALISALLISQSAITGWTLPLNFLTLHDNPNHSLKSLLTFGDQSRVTTNKLKIIESSTVQDSPQSFASYQKLKSALYQHNRAIGQKEKPTNNDY